MSLPPAEPPRRSSPVRAQDDPQIRTLAKLKESRSGGEVLVFRIPLSYFELICVVTVPNEGTTEAPVYAKFRVRDYNNTPDSDAPQVTVTGRLRDTKSGDGEVIVFSIFLQFIELLCIVTVPEEGTTEAPAYIKFKINQAFSENG
jgi:hypothetical protein